MPIRTRLTLTFSVLMAIVLTAGAFFLYLKLQAAQDRSINQQLNARGRSLVASIKVSGRRAGSETHLIRSDEVFAEVLRLNGTVLDSSPSLGGRPLMKAAALQRLQHPQRFEASVTSNGGILPARFLALPAPKEGLVAIVGTSKQDVGETLGHLKALLLIGVPLALGLTTAIIWFLAGAALRPVERMRAEAAAISGSELERRLPVPATGDEIERLGTTFNDLLERLHQAFERERRFVDDASHELRTPLSILNTEIELALRRSRTPEELQSALRNAGEQSDQLIKLSRDLLVLARADRSHLPVHKEPSRLDALIQGAVEELSGVAATAGVRLASDVGDAPQSAEVDPDRIRQALRNLIENAIRHTPRGGRVDVSLGAQNGMYRLAVADTGSGFPDGFIGRAFDPFVRADYGRSRAEGGTGLGLAIVKAIAEAHGGSVAAENDPGGGAVVSLCLPR